MRIVRYLRLIYASLASLHEKVDHLMSQQDHVNADLDSIEADELTEDQALGQVESDLATLRQQQQSGQPLDAATVARLDKVTSDLRARSQRVAADAAGPPPTTTPPTPTPDPGAAGQT